MSYDHEAIYKVYPDADHINEGGDTDGIFKADGTKITIDQSLVDAARVELAKEDYKWQREKEYPNMGVQLDYIYHNGVDKWKTDIVDPVKAKYPKPS